MTRKPAPVDMYQDPTIRGLRDESQALLMELAGSLEVQAILERLTVAQANNDDENLYEEPWARKVEAAMGHLRMALEAAGRTF